MKQVIVGIMVVALVWSIGAQTFAQTAVPSEPIMSYFVPQMLSGVIGALAGALAGAGAGVIGGGYWADLCVRFQFQQNCEQNAAVFLVNGVISGVAIGIPVGTVVGVSIFGSSQRVQGNLSLAVGGAIAGEVLSAVMWSRLNLPDRMFPASVIFLSVIGAMIGYNIGTTINGHSSEPTSTSFQFDMPLFEFNF